jgi:uncharacterized protein (TIGR02466 family)
MKKQYPKILKRNDIFPTPIWHEDCPQFVSELDKASNPHIEESKKRIKKDIDLRNKNFGNKKDMSFVYHSKTLIKDKKFKNFLNYAGATSKNLLLEMGFDLNDFEVFTTEAWVQEFAKHGGGHHMLHTHWNGHISGFYFLKGSEKTSRPYFDDPRSGNMMNLLPQKDKTLVTYSTTQINYEPRPGRIMFFPSYLPHLFSVDCGYEPFRFIHFNCQAIPKSVFK